MQAEVGEVHEAVAAGRGGSSAMPHKRNPTGCVTALEAAGRTPMLAATLLSQLSPAHERGLGDWQGQFLTLRSLLAAAAGALDSILGVVEGLVVNAPAMRSNIDRLRGLVYSEVLASHLAASLGRDAAQALVTSLCAHVTNDGGSMADVIRADREASRLIRAADLERLLQPQACYGDAPAMIEATLAEWRRALSPSTA
jgi:3-carboxy-cis,cis-muconate cycloisomerase